MKNKREVWKTSVVCCSLCCNSLFGLSSEHIIFKILHLHSDLELLVSCKGTSFYTNYKELVRYFLYLTYTLNDELKFSRKIKKSAYVALRRFGVTQLKEALYCTSSAGYWIPRQGTPPILLPQQPRFYVWAGQEEEVERGIAIAIVREFNRFLSPFCVLEIICFESVEFTTTIISSVV